jgi:excisionase family DNA binding protein
LAIKGETLYSWAITATEIDLNAAADQLGVHYQTAYKWVRSGALPARRVLGRYVLDPNDVASFAERRSTPSATPTRRPRGGYEQLSEQMTEALSEGDRKTVRRIVSELIKNGVALTTVVQELLVPALSYIGSEWSAGRVPIWVEHRASAIVQGLLGEHDPNPRGHRRGIAVVASLSGDVHGLPTSMAAAALREDNWSVHHLGADMPADEIVRFCEEHETDLAVLTVTIPQTRRLANKTAERLENIGTRTLVGQPGSTLVELQNMARDRGAPQSA